MGTYSVLRGLAPMEEVPRPLDELGISGPALHLED
jgi:hypothetical protein